MVLVGACLILLLRGDVDMIHIQVGDETYGMSMDKFVHRANPEDNNDGLQCYVARDEFRVSKYYPTPFLPVETDVEEELRILRARARLNTEKTFARGVDRSESAT